MSIIHKAAPGKGDGLTFVLSDATRDRYGDEIVASGWDLRAFKQNPIALFGHSSAFPVGTWKNLRIEGGKLLGDLALAARGTSQRIDELISLVEQGILRAVSVGFKPVESEPLEDGGRRYTKQELLETSLVSVPANPSALAVAKSMQISDDTLSLAFDEQVTKGTGTERRGTYGEHAATHSTRKTKMNLSQRIEAMHEDLVTAKDALTALQNDDDFDADAINEANDKIEGLETKLAALKRSEQNLAAKSAPSENRTVPATAARRPLGVAGKSGKPSDIIVRSAAVFAVSQAAGKPVEDILAKMYGDDESTGMVVKAAVAGATTTTSGWAAELVNEAMTDFLESLRPMSVYPALAAAGGGRLAFGPNQGSIKVPSRASTPSIGGSFVGEGAPIPVRRLGLTSITLSPKKMGVISVFSREIARYSTPAIEALIRQEIQNDTAVTLDSILLDASAASAVRPAGLLNGVTPLTATVGGGYGSILGDLRNLRAPFTAANAAANLMLLMNPEQEESLNLTPGADGSLGWTSGIISRYRVASSTAIPIRTVIMVKADDFVSATGDTPEFETSNDATIHMEDTAPAQIGTAGTPNVVAAPVQSMFQTAQTSIRMLMDVSWAMRRGGMVQVIPDVNW
ncbi:MAG: phage major capsid protein [Parvularcula sp.]|jgi:HK97 family phage major capsid protein/HK97 family phage prohead protease|nr:phage major capsid protein [Parvularcula sp.]